MQELKSFADLPFMRKGGRKPDQLRDVRLTLDYIPSASGSVLIECGNTRVICVASIEDKVPRWMMQEEKRTGWITAEYSLLPYAGGERKMREATAGRLNGRTQEVQRLIGRALRSVVDLKKLGERTLWIDCDVIEADGGTRTASITGGYVAMYATLHRLVKQKVLQEMPLTHRVAAVSVGVVEDHVLLDLDYAEDLAAIVDMNIVMTDSGEFVEVQGAAEEHPFSLARLNEMLSLAARGCRELHMHQERILAALG